VDRETGAVITIELDLLHEAEEAEEDPEDEDLTLAISINKDRQRYPRLPGRYQLHGYRLRTRSLTEIARDWCEEEGIAYVE